MFKRVCKLLDENVFSDINSLVNVAPYKKKEFYKATITKGDRVCFSFQCWIDKRFSIDGEILLYIAQNAPNHEPLFNGSLYIENEQFVFLNLGFFRSQKERLLKFNDVNEFVDLIHQELKNWIINYDRLY